LEARGVKYISVCSSSNLVGCPADPYFVGASILAGAEAATKVVDTTELTPDQRTGLGVPHGGDVEAEYLVTVEMVKEIVAKHRFGSLSTWPEALEPEVQTIQAPCIVFDEPEVPEVEPIVERTLLVDHQSWHWRLSGCFAGRENFQLVAPCDEEFAPLYGVHTGGMLEASGPLLVTDYHHQRSAAVSVLERLLRRVNRTDPKPVLYPERCHLLFPFAASPLLGKSLEPGVQPRDPGDEPWEAGSACSQDIPMESGLMKL